LKILVTGGTGYIGKRIIPILALEGHEIICVVRDKMRINTSNFTTNNVTIVEADFLESNTLESIPKDIDIAYYLMHSMSNASKDFEVLEQKCALNFKNYFEKTKLQQVIYLSGITNESILSKHLQSRKNVEVSLSSDKYALTTFKAGIIVGSGSSSFEIIRDLVEKLPIMITPKWLNTKTQPISIRDVLSFLTRAKGNKSLYNQSYDIFGPEVLTYKELLLMFSEARGLKRYIFTIPIMTAKLSSYWLYFVTSTSYKLASTLVDSMGVQIIGIPSDINEKLAINPIDYSAAVKLAFEQIEQDCIISSWKDSFVSSGELRSNAGSYINVPDFGCFKDSRSRRTINIDKTKNKIWSIGGVNGWYSFNFLWKIRGFLDKVFGGIGLRRGRTHETELNIGDALDFWRVIYADKPKGRLLLYAEMKLPGEAWLEFVISEGMLIQTATFRPKGLIGRLYWFSVWPLHGLIFKGLITKLTEE
jgi:uncharacterized protein YbjT (DUF2867 family)